MYDRARILKAIVNDILTLPTTGHWLPRLIWIDWRCRLTLLFKRSSWPCCGSTSRVVAVARVAPTYYTMHITPNVPAWLLEHLEPECRSTHVGGKRYVGLNPLPAPMGKMGNLLEN